MKKIIFLISIFLFISCDYQLYPEKNNLFDAIYKYDANLETLKGVQVYLGYKNYLANRNKDLRLIATSKNISYNNSSTGGIGNFQKLEKASVSEIILPVGTPGVITGSRGSGYFIFDVDFGDGVIISFRQSSDGSYILYYEQEEITINGITYKFTSSTLPEYYLISHTNFSNKGTKVEKETHVVTGKTIK